MLNCCAKNKSKYRAILKIFYVKQSSNLIGRENFWGQNSKTRLLHCLKELNQFVVSMSAYPAGIYLLKVNNRNTKRRCEIFSKLPIDCITLDTLKVRKAKKPDF